MYARHLFRDLAQFNRILDNVVVECSQGPRHIKDVIKMVPVVPLSRANPDCSLYIKKIWILKRRQQDN